jgi:DNA-binding CsgD family transcriptional regulator
MGDRDPRSIREETPPVSAADRTGPLLPHDLVALQRADGDIVILSFAIPNAGVGVVLTPAESDVLQHLRDGRTNAEIAALRATSPRTVANQIASLFQKLGVSSRLELVTRPRFAPPPDRPTRPAGRR